MKKAILITGSTDGIGLETAKSLIAEGHNVIMHGRNGEKLAKVVEGLGGTIDSYIADLSNLTEVEAFADAIKTKYDKLDVLINNAGIFKTPNPITTDGFDVRIVVNTISPYLLTQELLPILGERGRVVNLSSAAQAPVDIGAIMGVEQLDDMSAYAQSKLAITMWTAYLARKFKNQGPMIVAVNPGSLLASKMVKEGFGTSGNDIGIGVDILKRASLSEEFSDASGKYFDNDIKQFSSPHSAGRDMQKQEKLVQAIEAVIAQLT